MGLVYILLLLEFSTFSFFSIALFVLAKKFDKLQQKYDDVSSKYCNLLWKSIFDKKQTAEKGCKSTQTQQVIK